MDQFEKVEKLMSRANVTYAEAKDALETANWDLLDAMIVLEQRGKTIAPEAGSFSTSFKDQAGYDYSKTEETTQRVNKTKKPFSEKVKDLFKKSDENHLVIENKGKKVVNLPIWAVILILLVTIEAFALILIVFVISLFCGVKYRFEGPAKLDAANGTMNAVENCAESIKSSFRNAANSDDNNSNNY